MNYREIESLPASAYLNPETFVTLFDGMPSNVAERESRYRDGIRVSREAEYVSISARGTWSARCLDGGSLQSYEGIGYHANTAAFLRGLLDGPAPLRVYRRDGTMTEIKGRTEPPA
ncbi:MAG: hypothetical protein AB7L09_01845 [Nitrospira sp.]